MARPIDLPDYSNPPIAEAVLGVQFQQIPGFSSIYSRDVWELFRHGFPKVEEMAELPPQFEVFGGQMAHELQFRISNGPFGKRYWFVSDDDNQLIQFQSDRLHHNWRKIYNVESDGNKYPRFDRIIDDFKKNLLSLKSYFSTTHNQTELIITQAELTYVNHMSEGEFAPKRWFKALDVEFESVEGFSFASSKILIDENGPIGRLHTSINTLFGAQGERVLRHDLTVRGASKLGTIESAVEFLYIARNIIVTEFTDTTTDEAHKYWSRTT